MHTIDSKDLHILRHLQSNAKVTNRDLAKRVHLSQSSCLMRVKRLEQAGFITAYNARLDLNKLCRYVTCLVTVSISGQTREQAAAFERHVNSVDEILECYTVSGAFDFFLKVVAADMKTYLEISDDLIQSVEAEVKINTHVVMQELKSSRHYPLEKLL